MWKKKSDLNTKLLVFFLLFSILIITFLWLFQVLFLDKFYKGEKTNDIKNVAKYVKDIQGKSNYNELLDKLAFDKEVCIEVSNMYDVVYQSSYFGKGCIRDNRLTSSYKVNFINSNLSEKDYIINNTVFDNDTLLYAIKLDDNLYGFVNASLEPIDSTSYIIKKQLIIITILLFVLSIFISFIISKHLSKPIKNISVQAKKLAEGNFDVAFDDKSNILELNELSNTLNFARKELSKTEDLRRDLMANVSHDLKTPLTMIKAYAEMSIDLHSNNKKAQKEDINIIVSEVDRLTLLVEDILDLSKMQSNIENIDTQEFDLVLVINNILKKYQLFQELDNYKFYFIHDTDSCVIMADSKKIEQVLYNLINNAINYTGENNDITIKITDNKDNYLVEVTDSGKGINDDDLPYIWDRYYKNKKKHKRNLVGTGLGLSIVKRILELHNYNYGVRTKINEGTTFYFYADKKKS